MSIVMEESGKIVKVGGLIKRLMGGMPEDNGMNEHRIFLDVDPKSLGAPASNGLNGGKISTCFC